MKQFPGEKIEAATNGLRAIAHELRLVILCQLLDGPMCVRDIMAATGAGQANVSQHLAKMRMLGLLNCERRGQQIFYSIADSNWARVIEALRDIYCPDLQHENI